MDSQELLREDEISIATLIQYIKRHSIPCDISQSGKIIVEFEEVKFVINILENLKLLKFETYYTFQDYVSIEKIHSFINRMNSSYIFSRFSLTVEESNLLVADYYLAYSNVLQISQFIYAIQMFAQSVIAALNSCNEEKLLV